MTDAIVEVQRYQDLDEKGRLKDVLKNTEENGGTELFNTNWVENS